ncbi:hypothetical protein Acor_45200 [Acrocarpospora corrugata]|uniref:Uncharacterized protein n=1 Tax=Acrocarpospora corrugata TaxID=35763 RepID=A0A5M3W142_9ACTN|nr:hypothetical protein [Acrocarpospora corrugata]GES02454.1 hypothetical protein Acor_45200 [Acrocarpospora corrugata]
MAAVAWTRLGGPGEVRWAQVGDAATIAAGTAGGQFYLRRRTGAGWRWEFLGVPPGAENVPDAALVPVDGSDGVVPVVVGGDVKAWLRPPGAATPWTALFGPAPDVEPRFSTVSGDASAIRQGAGLRHTLVISSPAGRPWIRQGLHPDAVWFPIAVNTDWVAWDLSTVFASIAPGSDPQPHVFALASDRESLEFRFKVAIPENSLWTWIDPVGSVPGFMSALTVTAFLDGSGRLQACAVPMPFNGTADMLIGSGRDWRMFDLGQPDAPGDSGFIVSAVVVAKGPDPRPGEPVIMARALNNVWTRTLTGGWQDLGATPSDVDLTSAVEITTADGRERVLTAGISRDADLWTLETDAGGARWEVHGLPGSVTSIVGAYHDSPEPDSSALPVAISVLDENGALWNGRVLGRPGTGLMDPGAGFIGRFEFWTHHGRPAPGVTCTAGVGLFAFPKGTPPGGTWIFTIGSDGHLWARTADRAENWTWVDHGAPPGRSINAGVPPISLRKPPFASPIVHVLADDGRLWMRSRTDNGWLWTDRGVPPGQLIFDIVGAQPAGSATGRFTVAAAITGDGHLWLNLPEGATSRWIDLRTPAPTEKIVAGIGVSDVSVPNGSATLGIVVLGSPSGQVWSHRWSPDGTSQWTAHGRPADARPRGAIGTMQDPGNPAASLIAVIGIDQQLWLTSTTGGGWSRWDPPSPTTTITSGRLENLLHGLPCAMVLDSRHRVHVVTPAPH